MPLEEVEQYLGSSLPTDVYDTFGGFIFGTLGSIPDDGSEFELETAALIIRVTEIKDYRVEIATVCRI